VSRTIWLTVIGIPACTVGPVYTENFLAQKYPTGRFGGSVPRGCGFPAQASHWRSRWMPDCVQCPASNAPMCHMIRRGVLFASYYCPELTTYFRA
jgi:hypothetical protein